MSNSYLKQTTWSFNYLSYNGRTVSNNLVAPTATIDSRSPHISRTEPPFYIHYIIDPYIQRTHYILFRPFLTILFPILYFILLRFRKANLEYFLMESQTFKHRLLFKLTYLYSNSKEFFLFNKDYVLNNKNVNVLYIASFFLIFHVTQLNKIRRRKKEK